MVRQRRFAVLIGLILGVSACSSAGDELPEPSDGPGEGSTERMGSGPSDPSASEGATTGAGHDMPIVPPGYGTAPQGPGARADDPGGPPAGGCGLPTAALFARNTGATSYVGYVPESYDGTPTRLLVGLHGCGDSAWNFAGWGVNPWDTRGGQDYIGIAVDGASAGGGCWSAYDEAKVLAAIDDIATCLYVHKQKVVIAGFSSGGILAYRVGLKNAHRFAGIMILNSSLSGTGEAATLLAGASRHINVAHRAHVQDSVFPIGTVHYDWQNLQNAGFPVETSEVSGGHDGTSQDWTDWLIPQMAAWKAE